MQTATANGIQLFIKHFPNLVVSKSEGVVPGGTDQLRPHGFIERIKNRVFLLISGSRKQLIKGKRLAEHGSSTQDFVAVLAYSIKAAADRFLDALRDHQLVKIATFPMSALAPHRALVNQRFQDFLNKERIAFGFAVYGIRKVATHAFTEQCAQLLRSFPLIKTPQSNARNQALTVPID